MLLLLLLVVQVDEMLLLLHLRNRVRLSLGLSDRGQLVLLNQVVLSNHTWICIGVSELHRLTMLRGSEMRMMVVKVLRNQRSRVRARSGHCSGGRVAKGR